MATGTNGKHTSLADVREQLQIARAQLRLRETQARLRLVEGWGNDYNRYSFGDLVDPMDRYRDADGRSWSIWGANFQDRQDGNNGPFITTEAELGAARNAARWIAQRNPIGVGIVETVQDFVVGDGMMPRVTSREGADETLVNAVQDVVDGFVEDNEWDEWQQELVGRAVVDGEYFEHYYPQDGRLILRADEPEYFGKPLGLDLSDDWSWGIHNPPGDVATALEYARNLTGRPGDEEIIGAEHINHVKRNVPRNVKRGLSDFYATEDGMEAVRKLLLSMSMGEKIRASIVGFWKYENANSAAVSRHVAATRDSTQPTTSHPVTGKHPNYQRFDPGTIVHTPKGKEFQPPPVSPNAAAQTATVQAVLRHVLNRWGMPEYFSGDASNANFASTLVSGSPFTRRVGRWQKFFVRRFLRTIWKAIRVAWEAGRLGRQWSWEQIEFLIDVQLEPPTPTLANELQDAQVDEIDMRNGVLSKQTRRLRRGLDDEQERANLEEEPVTHAAAPEITPAGGAGANPFLRAFAG